MSANAPLAIVGTKTITEADVNSALASMGPRGEAYNNPNGRAAILDQLIEQALFLTDAKKTMMEYDPVFKAQLNQLKEDLLVQFAITKTLEKITATEADLKAFYDEHPEEFAGREMVSASHILVDSEEKANEILASIQSGEVTFEAAAKTQSSCPSSQNGGNLGEFGRGQMVKEFDEACFSMEVGELRGPVKTQFGYHIIRLDNKKTSDPISFEQAKNAIYETVLNQKREKAYRSKVNQMKIMYPVDRR